MVPVVVWVTGAWNIQCGRPDPPGRRAGARVGFSEEYDGVRFEVADGIGTITIDRPEAGNSLTSDQRMKMVTWFERADEDLAIRCMVLQATGRFFCTGADLSGGAPEVESARPAD